MADVKDPQTDPTASDPAVQASGTQSEPIQAQSAPSGTNTEPTKDWKAESRKWEDRAKENLKQLEEMKKQLESAGDDTGLKNRVSELEQENESLKVKVRVSKETGVPVDLLHGVTEDDISASAKAVSEYASTFAKTQALYPQDKGGAANAQVIDVNSIENPLEFVRARTKQLTNK